MIENEFIIDNINYKIKLFSINDNLNEYKELFLNCDNVLNKGKLENDKRLERIGEEYVLNSFQNDLLDYNNIYNIYFQGYGQFWLLYDQEKNIIIGSIALEDKGNNIGELRRMCISSNYRRQGLGNILVKYLIQYAFNQTNYFQRIFLTTPSFNTSAIEMYCKAGFIFENSITVTCGSNGELDITKLYINKLEESLNETSS